ncbi:hypothetical protein B0H14DRAFT_2243793, partial [Mycena olivaceomarginata]
FTGLSFTEEKPLTLHVIPWPVLAPPWDLKVEDVCWTAVEEFFTQVKPHFEHHANYTALCQELHRMFHPDTWSSRR